MDFLNYFITESGHPTYTNLRLPDKFPCLLFVADEPTENNTDKSRVDLFFFAAQDPSGKTAVYDNRKDLQLPC